MKKEIKEDAENKENHNKITMFDHLLGRKDPEADGRKMFEDFVAMFKKK